MLGFLFSLETVWGVGAIERRLWTEGKDARELESKGRTKDEREWEGKGTRRELEVGTEIGRDGGCERGGYGLVGMRALAHGEWGACKHASMTSDFYRLVAKGRGRRCRKPIMTSSWLYPHCLGA